MLWDIIRDFIVQHITGGNDSAGRIYHSITAGKVDVIIDGAVDDTIDVGTTAIFNLGTDPTGAGYIIGLPDWLATTITAVIMILIVVFAVWLVRWIFKAVSSAFLLK